MIVKVKSGHSWSCSKVTQKPEVFPCFGKAGIDDIYYQPHLGRAILMNSEWTMAGMRHFNSIINLLRKRRKKIGMDNESVVKQAFKVYNELISEKERKKGLNEI
jgi:hypothetical protein